jgi:uncharacterized membrane protein YebE (DUF533 family)
VNKAVVRVAGILVIGGLLVAGAVLYQASRKDALGEALLREFKDSLAAVEMDPPMREYAEGLAHQFHREAYRASFGNDAPTLGGTTDVNKYQRSLLDSMIAQARSDGQMDLADALEEFKKTSSALDLSGGGGG